MIKDIRRNEFLDLMNINGLIYQEKEHCIVSDIPKIGTITYYQKSNKIHVHKGNNWIDNGFIYIKNILSNDKS